MLRMQEQTGGAFDKVTKMIEELVVKLMEEANAEAEEKGWCDTEMSSNKMIREDKSESVEGLRAKIECQSSSLDKLIGESETLSGQVADLQAAVKEKSALRAEESAANAVTIKEAKTAEEATQRAILVLKDFYGGGGESFLQTQVRAGAPYTGMGGSSTGVIGMLETIASDFARLLTETTTAEDRDSDAHQAFLDESSTDLATKDAELKHKSGKMARLRKQIGGLKKDETATGAELETANKYFEELKPKCIDAGMSYEERVKQREAEMESLQEALEILQA